jgi:hypothetical protein
MAVTIKAIMKLFTVEEANELLPKLRGLLHEIDRTRQILQRLEPEARRASERASQGGGTTYGAVYAKAITDLFAVTQEILALGIEIKDFEQGLCDFPHLRDGRVVYLCWKKGEDRVEWWHDIEAGFAGRQPL